MMLCFMLTQSFFFFFFFNDTATTEIYTLSLHDALPIFHARVLGSGEANFFSYPWRTIDSESDSIVLQDRKSTRLNSSHGYISYAVFCLKKKKKKNDPIVSLIETKNDMR